MAAHFLYFPSIGGEFSVIAQTQNSTIYGSDIQDNYQLMNKRDCFVESVCIGLIFVDKSIMTRENLLKIVYLIEKKKVGSKSLRLVFFDDLSLAKAHAEGKKEPNDLNTDAKAVYYNNSKTHEKYFKVRCFEADKGNFASWANILN